MHDVAVPHTCRQRRIYDLRLRELVRQAPDSCKLTQELGIPRSTVATWKRQPSAAVISAPVIDLKIHELTAKVPKLERRVQILATVVRLLMVLVRTCGFRLDHERVPEGKKKAQLLRSIESARRTIRLRSVLRILGLNASRFHTWKRANKSCGLEDRSSCPKRCPQQLTVDEVIAMRDMATSQEYRHVPTGTRAMLAQRLGKVYASASTWYRFIKECGWRRPRRRIHPSKPTEGIRAEKPDEMWHLDTTVIRLLDGTKVYLQAVLDNYSRRILAWRLDAQLQPAATATLLIKAAAGMKKSLESRAETPSVMVDGGIENFNHAVDELVDSGILKRILAQTDLLFSNSLIEAFWRTMKHQWLFLNSLDSITALRRHVEFYVNEYNGRLPHSAFRGQTPAEMYFGTGDYVPSTLDTAKAAALRARAETNRGMTCGVCVETSLTMRLALAG